MTTVGISAAGDMGSGVGRALTQHGVRVVVDLTGRSEQSRTLAERAGMEDVGSRDALVRESDVILSILPPGLAERFAGEVVQAMGATSKRVPFADCNAITPDRARAIGDMVSAAGAPFVDIGIIGSAPGKGRVTNFYACGPDLAPVQVLDGKGMKVIPLGDGIGRASGLKMLYASTTKGQAALHGFALIAAKLIGLDKELWEAMSKGQPDTIEAMEEKFPVLAATADRWSMEMKEIAETLRSVGLHGGTFDAAAWLFEEIDKTPLGRETRATWDKSRTVAETQEIFAAHFAGRKDAAE